MPKKPPKPPKPADQPSRPRTKRHAQNTGFIFPPFLAATQPAPRTVKLSALTQWPTPADRAAGLEGVGAELLKGSDRAAAIVGCLYAHDAINLLIVAHMERRDDKTIEMMTGQDGTLYSFGSGTMLAYAMGLIDEKTKIRLDTIRRIRNAFAHSFRPISFGTQSISDACRGLDYRSDAAFESLPRVTQARYEFVQTVLALVIELMDKVGTKARKDTARIKRRARALRTKQAR